MIVHALDRVATGIYTCSRCCQYLQYEGRAKERNVYRLLVGTAEGKRPLGRPRRRLIDYIMIYLLEIGLNVVDWIGLAQDR
jgi:hypothetical protein